MRMRRKKNLESRVEDVSPYLIHADLSCLDARIADKDKHFAEMVNFDSSIPLVIELGCGKGKYAIDYATQNPSVNYLAIEKLTNVIIVGAEKAQELELKNLKFLCTGAEYLERFLPDNSVDKIIINFPCPFHKETYHEKRLTDIRFLKLYDKYLKPDGEIALKTDNQRMFAYSIEQLSLYGFVISEVTLDLHNSKYNEDNIVTEYEQRYTEQGLPIYRLIAKKRK